ncbi:MAG TPA: hypothetical protein PLO78_07560 [Candidatus Omnitrophota bacterium]|nr:hypothetical protein [Candidatus Omnitrophota bacterium]
MSKKTIAVLLAIFFILFPVFLFAATRQVTLTTYLPSSQGSYKQIGLKHAAIGSNYMDPKTTCWADDPTCLLTTPIDAATSLVVQGYMGIGNTRQGKDGTTSLPVARFAVTSPEFNVIPSTSGSCPIGWNWYDANGDNAINAGECRVTAFQINASNELSVGHVNNNGKTIFFSDRSLTSSSGGPITNSYVLKMENDNPAVGPSLQLQNEGNKSISFQLFGSAAPTPRLFSLTTPAELVLYMMGPNVEKMIFSGKGIVIKNPAGSTSPLLGVNGSIKVGATPGTVVCDVTNHGLIRYSGNQFQFCDNTGWQTLGT